MLERGIRVEAEERVAALAEQVDIEVLPPTEDDGRQCTVRVDGRDVTWEIRSPRVEASVSPVSAYPGVREALTRRMRAIARQGRVVMVGRDIARCDGCRPEALCDRVGRRRARRRYLEASREGKRFTYDEVLAGIRQRDTIDSERETAPLRAAPDAILIDTTNLGIETMFAEVEKLVHPCEAGLHTRSL